MGFEIVIPGEPIAKQRPFFVHKDKQGKALPYVKAINKQTDEEAAFKWAVINYLGKEGLDMSVYNQPIEVICNFYMLRPKSHYGTGRNAGKLKTSAPKFNTKKKDCDNLLKFYLDCLNGLVWKDDAQVCHIDAWKHYSEDPRTEIIVNGLEGR